MIKMICDAPDIDPIKTGKLIQSYRLNKHYSVNFIATFAGVSPNAVYKWENGTNLPSVSNLTGLKKLYNLKHLDDLLVYTDIAA